MVDRWKEEGLPRPGSKLLDRYLLEEAIARGGMAMIYRARDLTMSRVVAVKVLPERLRTERSHARFLREARLAAQIHHPNVVETYEIGVSTKGDPILIMEFVAGPSMQNIIVQKQEHHVAGKRMLLIRSMCEALKYVHNQGFIHRDICPRNFILLPESTDVKLIDFGLTLPATPPFMVPGNRTGTPLYMSPEIVRRRPTDKRVDLFSLGVTFYCLIAFAHPWQGDVVSGRAALHHDTSPPKPLEDVCPNVDPSLARGVMQLMHPKVEERTPTIEQFIQRIGKLKSAYKDGAPSPELG